jgi:hypothetical protein
MSLKNLGSRKDTSCGEAGPGRPGWLLNWGVFALESVIGEIGEQRVNLFSGFGGGE